MGCAHPRPLSPFFSKLVVSHVLAQAVPQMALTDRDESVEALVLDRSNEPLRMRVAVRRAHRCLHDTDAGRSQQREDRATPLASRSHTNTDDEPSTPSAAVSVRTACNMKRSSGCGVEPSTCTRRDASSITNSV